MPTVKACTKCGEVKPLDGFYKDKSKRDGRKTHCKECMAEYARRYREEHLDKEREQSLRYRYENRDELLERQRQYYEENREVVNAKTSSYRTANQEISKVLSSAKLRAPWSEEGDAFLMSDNGMTVYEKAIHLGRTYESCIGRRQKLRKLRRTTNV